MKLVTSAWRASSSSSGRSTIASSSSSALTGSSSCSSPRYLHCSGATRSDGASDKPSSSSRNSSQSDKDNGDSAMAFGGGTSSRGGPSLAEAVSSAALRSSMARQAGGSASSSSASASASSSSSSPRPRPPPQSVLISGSAGKGAVPGYGKRKRGELPDQSRQSVSERDDEIVRGYEHTYAPTTRSPKAMPHHTYFSASSTSFNAASTPAIGEFKGTLKPKKTALIFPGQGSQYVAMCRDIYRSFRSARSVWHEAEEALITPVNPSHYDDGEEGGLGRHSSLGYIPGSGHERAVSQLQRTTFEEELAKSWIWDEKRQRRGRRGWLRDAVFFGDQLDLTRAENAQPSILVATLSILAVLRKEFSTDLVSSKVGYAAGHGSGTYAALVSSGALDIIDAVRLLRHRGLISSQHVSNHPILFPPGCKRPESIYETWAFANAGSGKGAELLGSDPDMALNVGGVPPTSSATDADVVRKETTLQQQGGASPDPSSQRGWKRTQMSGVMVRPGLLNATLEEVAAVQAEIRSGNFPGVATDEVVEVSNINSSLQIVLSGTRVGVSVACDRLRNHNLGARAVNLPVSGPYHSSLMDGSRLGPALDNLPLRDPDPGLRLVSSVDGSLLSTAADIRRDLTGALQKPVRWLDAVDRLRAEGVERFVCLGPGRACAHLLSKELGYRDRIDRAKMSSQANTDASRRPREYEVWSVATVEDIETLSNAMATLDVRGPDPAREKVDWRKAGGVDRATLAL